MSANAIVRCWTQWRVGEGEEELLTAPGRGKLLGAATSVCHMRGWGHWLPPRGIEEWGAAAKRRKKNGKHFLLGGGGVR